jgi:hypothetical protein
VGDIAPFRWFNAGDFGDTNLLNNDVMQIFRSAVNFVNYPPSGCDMLDAMDASAGDAHGEAVLEASNSYINQILRGDGALNVDDVYVTFRRSLDPSLFNVMRYWSNGTSDNAVLVPNRFRGQLSSQKLRSAGSADDSPVPVLLTTASKEDPGVDFWVDDSRILPGQTLRFPVHARVRGKYPLRVCMLGLGVQALDGAPAITQPITFTPSPNLGHPTLSEARGVATYAAAWLNIGAVGVTGDSELGTLEVTIPADAPPTAAYRVTFSHVSASPNGLGLLPQQVTDGLLTLSDRSASTWNDGIPDAWRLRYFGSLSNVLAARDADADGDGALNGEEFKSGTNPADLKSCLRLKVASLAQPGLSRTPVLSWPTVSGKTYRVECSNSLLDPIWVPLALGIRGTGASAQFTDPEAGLVPRFYRVRVEDGASAY